MPIRNLHEREVFLGSVEPFCAALRTAIRLVGIVRTGCLPTLNDQASAAESGRRNFCTASMRYPYDNFAKLIYVLSVHSELSLRI